jgi:hypothetical protein
MLFLNYTFNKKSLIRNCIVIKVSIVEDNRKSNLSLLSLKKAIVAVLLFMSLVAKAQVNRSINTNGSMEVIHDRLLYSSNNLNHCINEKILFTNYHLFGYFPSNA